MPSQPKDAAGVLQMRVLSRKIDHFCHAKIILPFDLSLMVSVMRNLRTNESSLEECESLRTSLL